jgi:E2/UBC family protein E
MTPLQQQFETLKAQFPEATLQQNPDGSATVIVPAVQLPEGWEPRATKVLFQAPVGYPQSRPDCFWTDMQLRIDRDPRVPQNTGANPMPFGPSGLLWFSWHVQNWSPNNDTLLTYFNVVKKRFTELR